MDLHRRSTRPRGIVSGVEPSGIAADMGVEPGDAIVAVNGRIVRDVIDFRFLAAEERIEIEVEKPGGDRVVYEVEKHPDESLGISFQADLFDGVMRCANSCPFCFVDALPDGMRESLYIKDDDYRLSFLHGNFVTLTNLREADYSRIIEQRLSPLYVSVHSTEPSVRRRLLGTPAAGDIMEQLGRLTGNGIKVHAQVVVCPGINDGPHLERTIADLASLRPGVASVGVVPVGLTRFTGRDCGVRPLSAGEASAVVDRGLKAHARFRDERGYGFVFLADELFLETGREIPPPSYYEDFPQYENGIGIAASFMDELQRLRVPRRLRSPVEATIACGVLAAPLLETAAAKLNSADGSNLNVLPVRNRFFGDRVTVSGLLTGYDIIRAAEEAGCLSGRLLIVPSVSLRNGRFLDDLTPGDVEAATGARVAAAGSPRALLDILKGVEGDSR